MTTSVIRIFGVLCFWGFIGVKLGGTAFATWSWWWVLFAPAPVLGVLGTRFLGL